MRKYDGYQVTGRAPTKRDTTVYNSLISRHTVPLDVCYPFSVNLNKNKNSTITQFITDLY